MCIAQGNSNATLSKTRRQAFINSCQMYQQTSISALAELTGYGLKTQAVYITPLVSIYSTNPEVVAVDKDRAMGISSGFANISVNTSGGRTVIVPEHVFVSNDPAKVLSLSIAAVTNVNDNSNNSDCISANDVSVHQILPYVNAKANISVYVNFDDGHYMDISTNAQIQSLSSFVGISTDS